MEHFWLLRLFCLVELGENEVIKNLTQVIMTIYQNFNAFALIIFCRLK